jgi:hypothetical protein
MNKNKGFILKPEMYTQEEWCKMYYSVIKEYRILQRKIEKDKEVERLNNIIDELRKMLYKRTLDEYNDTLYDLIKDGLVEKVKE